MYGTLSRLNISKNSSVPRHPLVSLLRSTEKLNTLSFDQLWTDYLQPLLQEYIQGMYNEGDIMKKFAKAYGYQKLNEGRSDEAV